MSHTPDILSRLTFWAPYLSTQWAGCVVSDDWPYEYEFGYRLLGVSRSKCLPSWKQFTRWHENVFDESDGYVDKPGTFTLSLRNNVLLCIQIHPGGTLYSLSQNNNQQTLGEIGPHWRLPALRWSEAKAFSSTCSLDGTPSPEMQRSFALLLLMPVVWLTEDDQLDDVNSVIQNAWITSRIANSSSASQFAEECTKAMNVGSEFRWWNDQDLGWVTDSTWSVRCCQGDAEKVTMINELVQAAQDA